MIKSCPVKCTSTTNQKINITSIKNERKRIKKNSTGLKTPRPLRSVLQHMCKHDTLFMQRIPEYASVILSASLLFKNLFLKFLLLENLLQGQNIHYSKTLRLVILPIDIQTNRQCLYFVSYVFEGSKNYSVCLCVRIYEQENIQSYFPAFV